MTKNMILRNLGGFAIYILIWYTKSITIRCAKCQIFGISHTKHQKTSLMRCSECQKNWHWWTIHSQIWKRTDRCCKILMIFLFFSLSSLCQSLPSSLFFSNTDHSSLILSYFLLSPSLLFHADTDADANTSLPHRSLSNMEIWKRTNRCCKILIFFLFFSLSSLC